MWTKINHFDLTLPAENKKDNGFAIGYTCYTCICNTKTNKGNHFSYRLKIPLQ